MATVPGHIYPNHGRYWWKVKLPGADEPDDIPLKPVGAKYATKELRVAKAIARQMYQEALAAHERDTGDIVPIESISDLTERYRIHLTEYYPDSEEPVNIGYALTALDSHFGTLEAASFDVLKLAALRDRMIRKDGARQTINRRIAMIKRMFKWATSQKLVPAAIWQELDSLEGLRKGRSAAREGKTVRPIARQYIELVQRYAPQVIVDMMELQYLTGMRSGELCRLSFAEIDTSGPVWQYQPEKHKTAHRGQVKLIALGPAAQRILTRYRSRDLTAPVFSPADALAQRGRGGAAQQAGYDSGSYRKAVDYAIGAARKAGHEVPDFTPHQIVHAATDRIRKLVSLDAARAVRGHQQLKMTDHYTELNWQTAAEVAAEYG